MLVNLQTVVKMYSACSKTPLGNITFNGVYDAGSSTRRTEIAVFNTMYKLKMVSVGSTTLINFVFLELIS